VQRVHGPQCSRQHGCTGRRKQINSSGLPSPVIGRGRAGAIVEFFDSARGLSRVFPVVKQILAAFLNDVRLVCGIRHFTVPKKP
jgi:hypothetical protein